MGLCQKDHHLNFCNSPILAIKNLKVKWVEKIHHRLHGLTQIFILYFSNLC